MTAVGPNAAQRLENELRRLAEAAEGREQDPKVRTLWREAELNITSDSAVARRMGLILRLADECRYQLRAARPRLADRAEAVFEQIESAVLAVPAGRWSEFWSSLGGEPTLAQLTMVAEFLTDADHRPLRIEDVHALRDHLAQVLRAIQDESIPGMSVEERDQLCRRLAEMIASLYGPHGTSGRFGSVAEGLSGWLIGDHELVGKLWATPAGRRVVCVVAALTAVIGGWSPEALLRGTNGEAPDPDPVVQQCVILDLDQVPALGSGEETPALPPTSTAPGP